MNATATPERTGPRTGAEPLHGWQQRLDGQIDQLGRLAAQVGHLRDDALRIVLSDALHRTSRVVTILMDRLEIEDEDTDPPGDAPVVEWQLYDG